MQNQLPKFIVATLVVIAVCLLLIVYKLFQSPGAQEEEKVIYIDAASGKVYEQGRKITVETTEEKLRKAFPNGRTY
ncbi:MAG TPA: hypothetical protein VM871_09725 [Flavisolibacter sp.]|jgi:hypothetical protein|nr:hypothetical protein [Flavisolibacter sp.]